EDRARDPMQAGTLGRELDQYRDRAVGLGGGLREEAVGHLALHHHAPELEAPQAVKALDDQRCGDVVGQVRDELRRCRLERGEVKPQRVAEVEVDVLAAVERLAQARLERTVELDGVHVGDAVGEVGRQYAEARADLEHDVPWFELGQPADHAEQVLVDQEVLAELLLRGGPAHPRPKAALALASSRVASSLGSSPRASASAATVWTTFAGSFGRPRLGCGARYGLSVSASSRSCGTARAAWRSSSAFG